MITVTPIQNKEEQAALCALCGIEYLPRTLAYRTEAEGFFVGMCQFYMDEKGGHITHIAVEHEDAEAVFLMGRAALNFIDLCGVHTAAYEGDATDETMLRRIGFQKDETGRWRIDLTGFFDHPCTHAAH